jgi:hypothetical protein
MPPCWGALLIENLPRISKIENILVPFSFSAKSVMNEFSEFLWSQP